MSQELTKQQLGQVQRTIRKLNYLLRAAWLHPLKWRRCRYYNRRAIKLYNRNSHRIQLVPLASLTVQTGPPSEPSYEEHLIP